MPFDLSSTIAALADPTARALLARLALGKATDAGFAEPLPMSGPPISRRLHALDDGGLVPDRRDAQWRPGVLKAGRSGTARNGWSATAVFREQSFERLDDYLRDLQIRERKHGRKN
jgi:DNA-binding transcriptional ArsR family regulator